MYNTSLAFLASVGVDSAWLDNARFTITARDYRVTLFLPTTAGDNDNNKQARGSRRVAIAPFIIIFF